MKIKYNRFSIIPFHCNDCYRYVWLERYRKLEIYHHDMYSKIKVCSECLNKYIK